MVLQKSLKIILPIIFLLVLGVFALPIIQGLNKNVAVSFASEVPGFNLDFQDQNNFNNFLKETNFYNVKHIDSKRQNEYQVDKIKISLVNRELPYYQVTYGSELVYASDYLIENNEINISVYILPKLLNDDSEEVKNRVKYAINSQALKALAMSIRPESIQTSLEATKELPLNENYIQQFLASESPNDYFFKLIRN